MLKTKALKHQKKNNLCTVCGCGGNDFTVHCPGEQITENQKMGIWVGQLNYINGTWIVKDLDIDLNDYWIEINGVWIKRNPKPFKK